jgi:glutaredoxin-like protein
VRLVFFTQTFGCDTCLPTRRILDQLASIAPGVTIEEFNLVLDKDKAAAYAVDRAPAVIVVGAENYGIRFYGEPSGYELASLVEAIRLGSAGTTELSAASLALVAAIDRPVHIQVFVTPTCVYCPRMAALAFALAVASPQITTSVVEITEFPDLAHRYRVTGVPKTVVNDRLEIIGAVPEDEFVKQIAAAGSAEQ